MWQYNYSTELYHHGVKGMKWGVRRAEKRLSKIRGKASKKGWSEDAKQTAELKTKNIKQLSNAEIKKVNERMGLEKKYKEFNPGAIQKGWKYVAGAVGVMGTAAAVYSNASNLVNIGKKACGVVIPKIKKAAATALITANTALGARRLK